VRQPACAAAGGRLSLRSAAARVVDALPAQQRQRIRRLVGHPGVRTVSFDDLEAELSVAAALFSTSADDARRHLEGMVLAAPGDAPPDPFSTAYAEWTWDQYRRISGRAGYSADSEGSPFDLQAAITRPYPYQTGSARLVGRDLVARGHLMGCLGDALADRSPLRVVEFGPGWGNLTNDLVATGAAVTAVEIDEKFCALIEQRCHGPGTLRVVQADMLTFASDEPFDAAVFFESFHHCADHLSMLGRLHDIVRPDGVVFFASEPVQPMPYPWGPRLDGLSVWSSRTYGWLELGFDAPYFDQALKRTGWRSTRKTLGDRIAETDVIVATPS
jgi:2-polyprenyl-3-methyl-5-hydroxy-6-metoxy-1,4-benzoquinol methylase